MYIPILANNVDYLLVVVSVISAHTFINIIKRNLDIFEPVHEISNNVVFATCKASDQPAHTRSPIRAFASRLSIL